MAQETNLRISVENFGPICEGVFELKPLTIFVGPNNSGKSYMAFLVYALSKALSGKLHRPFISAFRPIMAMPESNEEYKGHMQELLPLWRRAHHERKPLPWKDLPPVIQKVYQQAFKTRLPAFQDDLEEALRDYFGCEDLGELIRQEDGKTPLSVRLNERGAEPPFLNLRIEPQQRTHVEWAPLDFSALAIPASVISNFLIPAARSTMEAFEVLDYVLPTFFWGQRLDANGITWQDAYYLPAARSGILYGGQAYASMAVEMIRRRVGLERIEVPPFTGVVGDFLQLLWSGLRERFVHGPFSGPRQRQKPTAMHAAMEILEGKLFKGEVVLEERRAERPLILYKSDHLQLPLQRASSMVGELAPLDLWIKYLLKPGDLLIIDEPEAHLHPESQRGIAQVLVRLMRAGVKILCTTHSSTILHQISNHVLATGASPRVVRKLHFTQFDLLKPEEVGVYLFDLGEEGTRIKDVPIEPGFGISEEEFVRVAEAIGEETFELSASLAASEGASS